MIGSFIDRMNARVCYGSSGGSGGGGGNSISRGIKSGNIVGVGGKSGVASSGKNAALSIGKKEACALGAGALAAASYVPHPGTKYAVIGGTVALTYACS